MDYQRETLQIVQERLRGFEELVEKETERLVSLYPMNTRVHRGLLIFVAIENVATGWRPISLEEKREYRKLKSL